MVSKTMSVMNISDSPDASTNEIIGKIIQYWDDVKDSLRPQHNQKKFISGRTTKMCVQDRARNLKTCDLDLLNYLK